VSIIIPAWQERGTLIACLTALSHEQYDASCEIIVVAGGSDDTLEAARSYALCDKRIRVVPQRSGGGKNGAMNDGARIASGEVLVFLDADTFVTTNWLRSLVSALGTDFAASTGKYLARHRTLIALTGEMSQLLENEARGRVLLQGSGGMAIRRQVFDTVGGIPEGRYADDWALSKRLLHAGYQIAYAPSAVSWSERPADLDEWWRNELRWRRIHLLSLFSVARTELDSPLSALLTLYPYLSAWAGVSATLAMLVARRFRLPLRPYIETGWLAVATMSIVREAAGPFETVAYTGQAGWLRTAAVLPVLTMLGWTATALATLTTHRANLHFKGPRRPVTAAHRPVPLTTAPLSATEGAHVADVRVGSGR
jgi:cellulose synthase/poly-beta-1,6-N-acetylglucosamine synthase-like glycosyltransferase